MLNFFIGLNVGVFFAILVLSKFKMNAFLTLGKKFVDTLENKKEC